MTPDTDQYKVEVVEFGVSARRGYLPCEIGLNIHFDNSDLELYFFSDWNPIIFDAMLVAAAIEFCDKSKRRPIQYWSRHFRLVIPVHDCDLWTNKSVLNSLHEAIKFLTGDDWEISFTNRKSKQKQPRQGVINLIRDAAAILPYSDGMDSCAVSGILGNSLGDTLIRVKIVESKSSKSRAGKEHFAAIPFIVKEGKFRFVESSVRSRGFKFSLISGLAAYLANAKRVIVPESGQGVIGPSLLAVGQTHRDFRNHPAFTVLVEKFISALLDRKIKYEFPRLWNTKAQTLRKYVDECSEATHNWPRTRSCWMDNRHASVGKQRRQCGICAACLLRRMSVHAANLSESDSTYIWNNLDSSDFELGADRNFNLKGSAKSKRHYAIAGVLHLGDLASMGRSHLDTPSLNLTISQLAKSIGINEVDAQIQLSTLLRQHEVEWKNFLGHLGKRSFIHDWNLSANE